MPTSGDPEYLVDTSLAVALVVSSHEHHDVVSKAIGRRRLGLAGHAAFETFSVLTRLPAPDRRTPAAVERLLSANFPHTRFLSARGTAAFFDELASHGITGGSVYDALVGAAAREAKVTLATRDPRALATYQALGVRTRLLT